MPSSGKIKYLAVFVYDKGQPDGIRLVNMTGPWHENYDHYVRFWPRLETESPDYWIYVEHEE